MNQLSDQEKGNLSQPLARSLNSFISDTARILIIDPHSLSRMTMVDCLKLEGYQVFESDGKGNLVKLAIKLNPDLIILDLSLPESNGFIVCQLLKQEQKTCLIPVILTTVSQERKLRLQCFQVEADDLLTKPLDRIMLSARVKSLIKQKRLHEGLDQTEQVLYAIASAIENRSVQTGQSYHKLAELAQAFGDYLKLTPEEVNNLVCATYLHDIGTVAIPEHILLKQGPLTQQEQKLVQQHVLVGEELCQPLRNKTGILPIIRHHHERWNGTGYPDRISGDEIPWLAQVFQVLDIYDALMSVRPHKQAYTCAQALEIIKDEERKKWRNPEIVRSFLQFIQGYKC